MLMGVLVPYLLIEVVFAITSGMILSSSLHMLISASTPQENASVVTLANLSGYVGSTEVSIAMSAIANTMALGTVLMVGFAISMVFMIPGFATRALRK